MGNNLITRTVTYAFSTPKEKFTFECDGTVVDINKGNAKSIQITVEALESAIKVLTSIKQEFSE